MVCGLQQEPLLRLLLHGGHVEQKYIRVQMLRMLSTFGNAVVADIYYLFEALILEVRTWLQAGAMGHEARHSYVTISEAIWSPGPQAAGKLIQLDKDQHWTKTSTGV